jgi:cell division protein FtsZ
MANKGLALMGTGTASGAERAIKAAKQAISSPLLEDISIEGATGIIINITGSSTLTTFETNQAVSLIMEAADEDAEIIFGTVIDDTIGDSIKITVIATGLQGQPVKEDSSAIMRKTAPSPERREEIRQVIKQPEAATYYEANTRAQSLERDALDTPAIGRRVDTSVKSEINYNLDREIKTSAQATPINTDTIGKPRFNLAQSLKDAANRYEAKKVQIDEMHSKESYQAQSAAPQASVVKDEPVRETRVKSIAEKLGFMNFDEDEFDTPSFLKKERNQDKSLN